VTTRVTTIMNLTLVCYYLNKGQLIVGVATYSREVLSSRNTIFHILKLDSNPKGGASDEMIMHYM
jgi:hypothetical protein